MSHTEAILSRPLPQFDYSLTGVNSTLAVEKGLAEAEWYQCPVPRETMRKLLERRDGPAIRDTMLWFALLLGVGYATYALWGTWWAIIPYLIYGVIYASTSDSRWHEIGPRHRLQDRLDEQCALRDRLVHGHARGDRLALEPQLATTATRSSSAAIPRSPCRARPTCSAIVPEVLRPAVSIRRISRHLDALHRADGRRGEDLHSRIRVPQESIAGAHLRRSSMRS